MFTVFTIARNRTAEVAKAVLGTHDSSIAVTDRCSSYDWIGAAGRQICWSHTIRTQSTIGRGPGGSSGLRSLSITRPSGPLRAGA